MTDQFKLRRRIASSSFITVILLIPILLCLVIFGNVAQAPLMNAVMPILVIVIPSLVANISHYMHLVHKADNSD